MTSGGYPGDDDRDDSLVIALIPVDSEQAHLARAAFNGFGKSRHPAGLNYGDCFSYAAAAALGEPLVCKGDDFTRTDLRVCAIGDTGWIRAGVPGASTGARLGSRGRPGGYWIFSRG